MSVNVSKKKSAKANNSSANNSSKSKNSNTITIKLKKGMCGLTDREKANIRGLGLKKISGVRTLENTPCVRGMIKKIIHMVEIVG